LIQLLTVNRGEAEEGVRAGVEERRGRAPALGERRDVRSGGEEGRRQEVGERRGRRRLRVWGARALYTGEGKGAVVGRFWLLGRLWVGCAESKNPPLGKDTLCAESKALGRGNFT
jgi:hypothetical protein